MSTVAARLFTWIQDAEFYRAMHLGAADMLPYGGGLTWLDVGCGPGVLTRIAACKGYAARGIDRDPQMIKAARGLATERYSAAEFAVADIDVEVSTGQRYDVVSASSLLVVLPKPAEALLQLLNLTKPGGSVLIIEAAPELTRLRAAREFLSGQLGRRAYMLQIWATFRAGRALSCGVFDQPGAIATHRSLLNGLASAWVVGMARDAEDKDAEPEPVRANGRP
jgi:SAM-dependent methyltransferase